MPAPSKPIWKSKTFWLNLVGAAVLVGAKTVPDMGLDPATMGLVMTGLNVANRFLTAGETHILPQQ